MRFRVRTLIVVAVCAVAGLAPLRADETAAASTPTRSADEAGKLSENLIYSVDRTPENVFDTARGVQVITREQITRANVQTLGQLLERQTSFAVNYTLNGSMPMVRGLAGKQVLFLIDGAKVNNAVWRAGTKEYLNLIDLNQVERIEIVRGVVSVLGTESLGAVVNIITRKNGPAGEAFGGSMTTRYSSADGGVYVPVDFYGSTGSVRYNGGISYGKTENIRAGGDIGTQPSTGSNQTAAHLNGQWLLSPEKTVEFGTQVARAMVEGPLNATLRAIAWDPAEMQFGRLSYQDLTGRRWEDSLKLTVFGNRQKESKDITIVNPLTTKQAQRDVDTLGGANMELGKFLGGHHLVYGVDYTNERVRSHTLATDATGKVTDGRGNFMDGSSYRTVSAYLQDRFDIGQRLTLIGGLRGGHFEKNGDEKNNIGTFNIDDKRTNTTGALNAIFRVTPSLNVIANAMKGYRVPNLDDVSHFLSRQGTVEVPNPQAIPEKVLSTELGLKYSASALSGSLIWFKNDFHDLLVRTNGLYLGLPFRDTNGNGRKDPGEAIILQNLNVGQATISGVESDFSWAVRRGLSVYGNYSRLRGDDTIKHQPLPAMPPAFGVLGVRYASAATRSPWGELEYRFAEAQTRLNAVDLTDPLVAAHGVPAYHTVAVRTGMMLTPRFGTSLAVENIFDKGYRFNGSLGFMPGRQVVLGTQFNF